jgi:hypothetical protein
LRGEGKDEWMEMMKRLSQQQNFHHMLTFHLPLLFFVAYFNFFLPPTKCKEFMKCQCLKSEWRIFLYFSGSRLQEREKICVSMQTIHMILK